MGNENKLTILMADDDSDDRFLFEEALMNIGTEVALVTANNGKQVIDLMPSTMKTPDLIFLDISMPLMDGWECLQYIKADEKFSEIPVIMYSTSDSKRDVDKSYELGATCFCTKPDNFKDLVDMLKVIVNNIGPHLYKALEECKECKTVYIPGNENYRMLSE